MGGRGRSRGNRHRNQSSVTTVDVNVNVKPGVTLAGDSPVLAQFLSIGRHLTKRQDRHEKLVKLSRDITVESKRVIFLLHSSPTKEKTVEQIIAEAKNRFAVLIDGSFKAIAYELEKVPAHLHNRAITAGLQEFVEARTLCSLMEHKQIITYPEVRQELKFVVKGEDEQECTIATPLPHLDYMLGLADLTGELMRKAVNSIAIVDKDQCTFSVNVLRRLYAGFVGVFGGGPVLASKLNTTRANVYKAEYALYTYAVRGSEMSALKVAPKPAPKPRARKPPPAAASAKEVEEDQGYCKE